MAPVADTAVAVLGDDPWWSLEDEAQREPVAPARPAMTTEARALENLLVGQFDGHDLSLPPMPRVPEIVLSMLSNAKFSLAQVAAEIGEDQVCAAAVLRLANSPLYRGLDKITALQPAVVRLGGNALRTLMLHQAMRSMAGGDRHGAGQRAHVLSVRALASAACMRSLARFGRLDPEEAFLIGLLHDIGSIMVLRIARNQHSFTHTSIDDATFEYLCFESHQEFGELIAKGWSLPDRMTALIGDHHRHPEPDDPLRTERLLLELCDMICAQLGYCPGPPYDLLHCRAACELGLNGKQDYYSFLMQLPAELEETMLAFD